MFPVTLHCLLIYHLMCCHTVISSCLVYTITALCGDCQAEQQTDDTNVQRLSMDDLRVIPSSTVLGVETPDCEERRCLEISSGAGMQASEPNRLAHSSHRQTETQSRLYLLFPGCMFSGRPSHVVALLSMI